MNLSRFVRPTVLVVCTANVCRSPYAEQVIESAFLEHDRLEGVQVGSAGVRPIRRARLCSLVAEQHPHTQSWDEFVERHSSVRATATRIAQTRLILTASRSNRAALAHIDPDSRRRTFTLREAAWLGADYVPDLSLRGPAAISAFARYLDSQRGMKPPMPAIRARLFSRPSDPLSIADGHNMSPKEHRKTLEEVQRVATLVATLIAVGSEESVPASV